MTSTYSQLVEAEKLANGELKIEQVTHVEQNVPNEDGIVPSPDTAAEAQTAVDNSLVTEPEKNTQVVSPKHNEIPSPQTAAQAQTVVPSVEEKKAVSDAKKEENLDDSEEKDVTVEKGEVEETEADGEATVEKEESEESEESEEDVKESKTENDTVEK